MDCKYSKWDFVTKDDYYKLRAQLNEIIHKSEMNKNEVIHKMDRDKNEITFDGVLRWGMIYVIFLTSLANCTLNLRGNNNSEKAEKVPASR